jgi:hypothetical protein
VASGSSLLRQFATPTVCALLVASPALALVAPAAAAPPYAPDPSPLTNLSGPDPYPAQRAPAGSIAGPIRMTTVPASILRLPAQPAGHRAKAVPKRAHAVSASKQSRRAKSTHATRPAPAVAPIRSPDHPAPRFVALARTPAASTGHVSRALALTLGLLVALSASLVAGAARELAR